MFLLTHIAVPLTIFEFPYIKKKFSFNRFALILGSIFPDLIDKTLMFFGLESGRGISHSLIFNFLLFISVVLIFKKKSIYLPFVIGISFHLILDMPELPLFYPFVIYNFPILKDPLLFYIHRLFTYPPVIITESLSLVALIIISIKNHLFNWTNLKNYIFKTHKHNDDDSSRSSSIKRIDKKNSN